jgi:hypothetical protein
MQRCRRGGGSKWGSPRVGGHQACSPRAGFVGRPGEEVPGALQDVSSCPRSHHRDLFSLFFLLILAPYFCRYADTGVLSLVPLKRLALSARVVPFEPRPQPLHAELHPGQVEEGLTTTTVVEEERAVEETTSPKLHWGHRPRPAQVARMW